MTLPTHRSVDYKPAFTIKWRLNYGTKQHRFPRLLSTGNIEELHTCYWRRRGQRRWTDEGPLDGDAPVLCQRLFPRWYVSPLTTGTSQQHRDQRFEVKTWLLRLFHALTVARLLTASSVNPHSAQKRTECVVGTGNIHGCPLESKVREGSGAGVSELRFVWCWKHVFSCYSSTVKY